MSENISNEQIPDNPFKSYKPIVTIICCLVSAVLFIGINLENSLDNWETYKKWGAPSSTDIFNGSYWGLISSNFLHVEIWHIVFNLYWFWFFGKKIEYESSKAFYGLLILSSALVSSCSQLAFSDSTGIGLSGIGYSFFGFIYIKSRTVESYKNYLDKKTINLFIIWLVACIILTQTKTWTIGNAAHIGGLIWGVTIASISKFERKSQWAIGTFLLVALTSSIFWNPFSTSWLSHQAYELHNNQKVEEAKIVYKKILSRDPDNEFAKENLKQLEIHTLSQKAVELHNNQQYDEARKVYNQILIMDTANQWAKENLEKLQVK